MRAMRYLEPYKLKVMEIPDPVMKEDECLLRVRACGICGSDVAGATGKTGRRIPPMTMGHEFAAEVIQVGSKVTGFQPGDGVIPQPICFCGECGMCRKGFTMLCENKKFFGVLTTDGAMAEYVSVPEKLLYRKPDSLTYYEAALTEPYAVTYGAFKKAGDIRGKTILIVGAGTIGDCLLQIVKTAEPNKIIMADLSDARLAVALKLGADHVINPQKTDPLKEISDLTDGHMVDLSFEAVGVEATANLSVKATMIGGTTVWLGMHQKEMTLNMQDVVCFARTVLGSFNYTHREFGEVVDLLGSGALDTGQMISEVVPLDDAPAAFERLRNYPDRYLKIIIDPTM